MALKTMLEKISTAREAYTKAKTEAGEALKSEVGGLFAEAFKLLPEEFVQVSWTQYTPYFNDGEACEFSVHDCYLQTAEQEDNSYDGIDLGYGTKCTIQARPELAEGLQALANIWDEISKEEDTLESAFGDHVRVVVKRNGTVSADEHSHD